MTVYILGAGPAGLALSQGLSETNAQDIVVLERGTQLGGLAQTLQWDTHGAHDLGPHKIFTLDQNLLKRVEALIPEEDWLVREKKSSIYMKGHFLPYPPSPFSLLGIYGLVKFTRMVFDYGFTKVKSITSPKEPTTFEEDLEGRVGPSLYEALFKPIALKLWGDPSELDLKLSQGRVQTPKITEVLARVLGLQKKSEFEALTFKYPKQGLRRLWQSIADKTSTNTKYLLQHEVTGLGVQAGRITEIRSRDLKSKEERTLTVSKDDFVFSTLPLSLVGDLLGDALPKKIHDHMREVVNLNDLLLVFLKIDRDSLLDESWVFIPDPEILFHRVSEQESFDPQMTPHGSIVCCEVMSHKGRPYIQQTDQELTDRCVEGLKKMGYGNFQVQTSRVIRLPRSYPVFRPGFEPKLKEILWSLDKIENFKTLGRQGAFNYIGTIDAMDIGFGAARWFLGQTAQSAESKGIQWAQERERTNHYPVLD